MFTSLDSRLLALRRCMLCLDDSGNEPMVRMCRNDSHYYCVKCAFCLSHGVQFYPKPTGRPNGAIGFMYKIGEIDMALNSPLPCTCPPILQNGPVMHSYIANMEFRASRYTCDCGKNDFHTTAEVVDHCMYVDTTCPSVNMRCPGCGVPIRLDQIKDHILGGCAAVACCYENCRMFGGFEAMGMHTVLHEKQAGLDAVTNWIHDNVGDSTTDDGGWELAMTPARHRGGQEFAKKVNGSFLDLCLILTKLGSQEIKDCISKVDLSRLCDRQDVYEYMAAAVLSITADVTRILCL